jgi:hypothetical protein
MRPLTFVALGLALVLAGTWSELKAEVQVVNPDGYQYIPSLTGFLGYQPGGDEPVKSPRSLYRAPGYTDEVELREPLSSACSILGIVHYGSPSKTRVDPALTNKVSEDIDEEVSNLNWDLGLTLYTGGTGEPQPLDWGHNANARGYYYWPTVVVEITDDTIQTSDTAVNVLNWSNTTQTNDVFVSVGLALPSYFYLMLSFDDQFAGTDTYVQGTINVPSTLEVGYKTFTETLEWEEAWGRQGKPDFNATANPTGWIGSVLLSYSHSNEAYNTEFISATELGTLRVPLSTMVTAFVQYQYQYGLPMTEKFIPTIQTASLGLVFFPGALLNP